METMLEIERHVEKIRNGEHEKVGPGQPAKFTTAASAGDCIWQGDLGLKIVDIIPNDYVKIEQPTSANQQLVPGNTQGARHCLDSLSGVELYVPKNWTEESLLGPCLVLTEERTVLHPVHGSVTIPEGFKVLCKYQRQWDEEEKRARRNAD